LFFYEEKEWEREWERNGNGNKVKSKCFLISRPKFLFCFFKEWKGETTVDDSGSAGRKERI
jgi:hypothetical protein